MSQAGWQHERVCGYLVMALINSSPSQSLCTVCVCVEREEEGGGVCGFSWKKRVIKLGQSKRPPARHLMLSTECVCVLYVCVDVRLCLQEGVGMVCIYV